MPLFVRRASRPRLVAARSGLIAATTLALGMTLTAPAADSAPPPRTQEPGVTASLWEWNWNSIARECPRLARDGYDGVQVAPPQNSLKRTATEASNPGGTGSAVLHPWWEVYQVVSYDLTSRMGNERQFQQMVRDCRRAGVKVYVDAVINHTTGQGSTSYGGQSFAPYNYPAIPYNRNDFHYPKGECSSSDGGIQDFNNKNQVFKCNLVGLEDLDTDRPRVQRTLAAYLNKLLSYGVSGFRVDAAKHVGQEDLDAIYSRLNRTKDGVKPYWALEVFQGGPGLLDPQAFTRSGDVLGLEGARQIQQAFKSYPAEQEGSLAVLEVFGSGSGLTASKDTMSFVTNHDTDRNRGEYLGYQDGDRFILANMWLLASGYGSPQIFSSFTWGPPATPPTGATPDDLSGRTQGPPSNSEGLITNANCSNGQWTCDHRNRGIVGMIGWNKYVGSAKRSNFYTDEFNVIAFSKGNRGWVAFNNGSDPERVRVQTGLPGGTYCDVVNDTPARGCSARVRVDRNGYVDVRVGARDAVAIQLNQRA
jgi:alpha-amylase